MISTDLAGECEFMRDGEADNASADDADMHALSRSMRSWLA